MNIFILHSFGHTLTIHLYIPIYMINNKDFSIYPYGISYFMDNNLNHFLLNVIYAILFFRYDLNL